MSWIGRARAALGLGSGGKERPWGDGFVDEGWDGLSGGVTWASVEADELVFLVPGLPRSRSLPPDALARLAPLVVAASQRADAEARPDPLGRAARAVLARTAAALTGTGREVSDMGLLEAAILSFETGLNGAYAVSSADLLGETLAAFAWSGILCRGRDAYLPGVLAPALRDALDATAERTAGPKDGDPYAALPALLGCRLQEAGLVPPLRRALATVETAGGAVLVPGARPHRPARHVLPQTLTAALDAVPGLDGSALNANAAARSGGL